MPGWPTTWSASSPHWAVVGDRATRPSVSRPACEWERILAADGWTCIGWPTEYGGRGASIAHQVIFNEEYARARAPGRVSVLGEGLLGPTIIQYGTAEQQDRFLPPIVGGTELWCQGYSEPNAGSDLANVQTKAVLEGDEWVITGQKVWTSLAHQSDWCFVVCRTEPGSVRHRGLSYLLVPMDQTGVEVRPITQLTRTSEFNEVFFDGARTRAEHVVGEVGDGWKVALATLAFERGVGLLGHQLTFRRELDALVEVARANGSSADPLIRQQLARSYAELEILRFNTLRSLSGYDGPVAPAGGVDHQTVLEHLAPPAGRAGHGHPGPRGPGRRGVPLRARRLPAHLLVQSFRDHLRRLQRDPEEHHRRAGPRPATRTQGDVPMTDVRPTPRPHLPAGTGPVPRRRVTGCSTGKIVVITAAAGTGIGFATAQRCIEEGATVVVSDAHERRLGESGRRLGRAARRPTVCARWPCRAT